MIDDVDHADILNPILREKGIRSLLGVPLLAEDRVLGVLHVGSLVPRRSPTTSATCCSWRPAATAVAIQHAALYERERRARGSAEAATRRLEALQRVADAALAYLSEEELLGELLVRITEILETDTAAILLLDETGGRCGRGRRRGSRRRSSGGCRSRSARGLPGGSRRSAGRS